MLFLSFKSWILAGALASLAGAVACGWWGWALIRAKVRAAMKRYQAWASDHRRRLWTCDS